MYFHHDGTSSAGTEGCTNRMAGATAIIASGSTLG